MAMGISKCSFFKGNSLEQSANGLMHAQLPLVEERKSVLKMLRSHSCQAMQCMFAPRAAANSALSPA
jgi:hypothetical protein